MNLPDLITLLRLPLLAALFLVFPSEHLGLILGVIVLIFITDVLDGYLARRLHTVSLRGKVLDHAVDKFVIVGVIGLLVYFRDAPSWLLWLFLVREVIASAVGLWLIFVKKVEIPGSNVWGKLTGFSFGVMVVAYVINFPWRAVFLWSTVVLALVASVSYALVVAKILGLAPHGSGRGDFPQAGEGE